MLKTILSSFLIVITSNWTHGQNTETFPVEIIDNSIIVKRGLQEEIKMLSEDCNWSDRVGKKIDVFWLQTKQGSFFGHSYEYFMDCDNVRLIYWYDNPSGKGYPVDFMVENLEDESQWVGAKRKHLKGKKKYQHLLEGKNDG